MSSFGSSPIVVPSSVHELVQENITEIPNRYIHDHNEDHISDDSTANYSIPVIDVEGLLSGESVLADSELQKLHSACQHWGFFQVCTKLLIDFDVRTSVLDI